MITLPKSVCITGNTATGTTTLTRRLHELIGWRPVYSEAYIHRNPFFDGFLRNPQQWAFHSQMCFTVEYLADYLAESTRTSSDITCFDYHIREVLIYARAMQMRGYLSAQELDVVNKSFSLMEPYWPSPAIIVHCTAHPETIKQRLISRGRGEEWRIDSEYVRILDELFISELSTPSGVPILQVATDQVDLRADDDAVRSIAAEITHSMERTRLAT